MSGVSTALQRITSVTRNGSKIGRVGKVLRRTKRLVRRVGEGYNRAVVPKKFLEKKIARHNEAMNVFKKFHHQGIVSTKQKDGLYTARLPHSSSTLRKSHAVINKLAKAREVRKAGVKFAAGVGGAGVIGGGYGVLVKKQPFRKKKKKK